MLEALAPVIKAIFGAFLEAILGKPILEEDNLEDHTGDVDPFVPSDY